MSIPAIQDFGFQAVQEGYPVEVLTAAFALAGGVLAFGLARALFKRGAGVFVAGFYVAFGLGLIFLAGEEVAWGQDLLGYGTPAFMERANTQDEMTFHNLEGWQGHNHLLRLGFGLGGLVGIALGRYRPFRLVGSPRILHAWFVLIFLKSVVDVYIKSASVGDMTFYIVNQMSEVVEMMVSLSALLYLWLNQRRFTESQADARRPVEIRESVSERSL